MGEQVINTFSKGMIQDFDKSVQPEGSYLEATNFRLVTSEGGTSASLENINGNVTYLTFDYSGTDMFYVGHANVRDELYVFVTENVDGIPASGDYCAILKFVYDTELETTIRTMLWYNTGLTLAIDNKIKAIGRYENSDVKKLYWVDDYNNI